MSDRNTARGQWAYRDYTGQSIQQPQSLEVVTTHARLEPRDSRSSPMGVDQPNADNLERFYNDHKPLRHQTYGFGRGREFPQAHLGYSAPVDLPPAENPTRRLPGAANEFIDRDWVTLIQNKRALAAKPARESDSATIPAFVLRKDRILDCIEVLNRFQRYSLKHTGSSKEQKTHESSRQLDVDTTAGGGMPGGPTANTGVQYARQDSAGSNFRHGISDDRESSKSNFIGAKLTFHSHALEISPPCLKFFREFRFDSRTKEGLREALLEFDSKFGCQFHKERLLGVSSSDISLRHEEELRRAETATRDRRIGGSTSVNALGATAAMRVNSSKHRSDSSELEEAGIDSVRHYEGRGNGASIGDTDREQWNAGLTDPNGWELVKDGQDTVELINLVCKVARLHPLQKGHHEVLDFGVKMAKERERENDIGNKVKVQDYTFAAEVRMTATHKKVKRFQPDVWEIQIQLPRKHFKNFNTVQFFQWKTTTWQPLTASEQHITEQAVNTTIPGSPSNERIQLKIVFTLQEGWIVKRDSGNSLDNRDHVWIPKALEVLPKKAGLGPICDQEYFTLVNLHGLLAAQSTRNPYGSIRLGDRPAQVNSTPTAYQSAELPVRGTTRY